MSMFSTDFTTMYHIRTTTLILTTFKQV